MYLHFMCSFVCLVLFFLLFHTVYFNFSELNMRPHITILKLQLMHMYIVFDWLLRTWLKRYIIFNFVIWLFVLVQTWMVKTILRHWWTFFSNIRQLRFVKKTCVICSFYESFQCDVYILYIRDTRVAQWVRSYLTAHTGLSLIRSGFAPSFENYKKGALDSQPLVIKVYQLLADGRWFSPAFSTTKTGRHDIAEILLCLMINFKPENT